MKLRLTRRALADLDEIFRYLDRRSPARALETKYAIEQRIALLADMPFIAPRTEESDVYELSILRYPHKVYYRVEQDEVLILHMRHTSRRSPNLDEV